jgi:hypothetical protein
MADSPAPAHVAFLVQQFLAFKYTAVFPHPSHLPDTTLFVSFSCFRKRNNR